jgi:hypothetical protein
VLSDTEGVSSLIRAIYTVRFRGIRVSADSSFRCVCRDTDLPEVRSKIATPVPQRRFPNVQALALLTNRLNYHMHMRMRFVSMKNQRMPICGPKGIERGSVKVADPLPTPTR